MPDTIRQQLVDAIKTAFQAINGAGGYNYNLSQKVHVWRDTENAPFEATDLPAIVVRDRLNVSEERVGDAQEHELTIEVDGLVAGGTAPDKDARKLLADLLKAIDADRSFGGKSWHTTPKDDALTSNQRETTLGGVRLRFACRYRTKAFDPYTAL